jgi:hypothetical protein
MENRQCSICRENNCNIVTRCNHSFHFSCLCQWLQVRETCPMCREHISVNIHGYNNRSYSINNNNLGDNSSEHGVDMTLEESIDSIDMTLEESIDTNLRILDNIVRLDISPVLNSDSDELDSTSELVDIDQEILYTPPFGGDISASAELEVNHVVIDVDDESGNMLIEIEEVEEEDDNNYRNLFEEMSRLVEQNRNLRNELYELREERIEVLREENLTLREENIEIREENIDLRNQNEYLRGEKVHLRIQVDDLERYVSENITDIQRVRNILNEVNQVSNLEQVVSSLYQETNIVENLQNRVRDLEEKDENSSNRIDELQNRISSLININQNQDERIEYLDRINNIYTNIIHLQGESRNFYKSRYQSKCIENIELMDENIQMLDTNSRLQRINDLYSQFYNTSSEFLNRIRDESI